MKFGIISSRETTVRLVRVCFLLLWLLLGALMIVDAKGYSDRAEWCSFNAACPYGTGPSTWAGKIGQCACGIGVVPP